MFGRWRRATARTRRLTHRIGRIKGALLASTTEPTVQTHTWYRTPCMSPPSPCFTTHCPTPSALSQGPRPAGAARGCTLDAAPGKNSLMVCTERPHGCRCACHGTFERCPHLPITHHPPSPPPPPSPHVSAPPIHPDGRPRSADKFDLKVSVEAAAGGAAGVGERERRHLTHTGERLNHPPSHSPMRRTTHNPRLPSHHRLQDRAHMVFVI